jgi:Holliday junction resolvase
MATTPEAKFSARVRDGLKALGCDIERIENRVNLGVSDMLVGVDNCFVTMELKVVHSGLKVKLRPHQIAFLIRHAAKGRPCFVLVLRAGGEVLKPERVLLYHGRDALALAADGLRLPPLADWPSRGMDWQGLKEKLSAPGD